MAKKDVVKLKASYSNPHNHLPMKMEQTEFSETSAHKIQTPGNHQMKEHNIRYGDHYVWRDVTRWEPRECFAQLLVHGDGPEGVQSVGRSARYPDSQAPTTLNSFACVSPPLGTFPEHNAASVWLSNEIKKKSVGTELRCLFTPNQVQPLVFPRYSCVTMQDKCMNTFWDYLEK